jgi:hypothetical protein
MGLAMPSRYPKSGCGELYVRPCTVIEVNCTRPHLVHLCVQCLSTVSIDWIGIGHVQQNKIGELCNPYYKRDGV